MTVFQNPTFYAGMLAAALSIFLKWRNKNRWALFCLFAAAIFLRLFMAHIDPYLHDWDERFHALVARNMMDMPFRPTLRINPVEDIDFRLWCCNDIWLHKQPLFMWQMALSMKIFGVSEFAIRYPSVLMGAILVLFVYRIAFFAAKKYEVAYAAALFMCCSNYSLELVSGRYGMDHNDVAFTFYVIASIWAYCEYINADRGRLAWSVAIGVFAGLAILNKWLVGSLVFSAWALSILVSLNKTGARKEIGHMLLAIGCCITVFLPWQIYIFHEFPQEAKFETDYNTRHVFEVIEGHGGPWTFYWDNFNLYFGFLVPYLLIVGGIGILCFKKYRNKVSVALVIYFLTVFAFYSFIVQTKMSSYFFIVVPLGFIIAAIGLDALFSINKKLSFIGRLVACALCILILDPQEIINARRPDDNARNAKIYNTQVYKSLKSELPGNIKLVMNANEFQDVEVMFYNKGITVYQWTVSADALQTLIADGVPIAVFKERHGYPLPEEIKSYSHIYFIKRSIK